MYRLGLSHLIVILSLAIPAHGGEILLRSGERLKGRQVSEDSSAVTWEHDILGTLTIPKEDLASEESHELKKVKGNVQWDARGSLGYELSDAGETETQLLHADFHLGRNRRWVDEWTWDGNLTQEYISGDSSAQRAETSLRYAWSFRKSFYNFYRMSAQHDFFENVNYRAIPSGGAGYWFFDRESLRILFEAGLGYEITDFRDRKTTENLVLHARKSFLARLNSRVEVGTDLLYFPKVEDFADYRLETEAFLRISLSSRLYLKVKFQDRYRSDPTPGVRKNISRLSTSLEFHL